MVQTWAEVFEVDLSHPHLEDEVASLVMALRAEIKFARERLDAYGVPANLTSPGFERLTQVASPGQLHSTWNGHRGNIQPPECRKIFEWAAWALREEEEADMSSEELRTLRSELDSLETSMREADMAPYLRDFIQRQIDTIRTALRMYGVQGVKPVEEALQRLLALIRPKRSLCPRPTRQPSQPRRACSNELRVLSIASQRSPTTLPKS
ncbi:MAG: hypothetical protein EPO01_07530 [Aquabacterium sp.]|nr:MAG: hypothetical protein EPO01_07530 [Aquabacterium sp.]